VIVEASSLSHRYGDRLALDQVSFSVERGRIFGLLGPNGGGKTTLFRIFATLLTPTKGSARVAGYDVVSQRYRVRTRTGIVFQRPSLDGKLTASENLLHHGQLYGLAGRQLRSRSAKLLADFGLSDRAAERVEKLSGGLQRRLELAKALLPQPAVLILDEPSTGLDPGARSEFMDRLQELKTRDQVTSLLTTHLTDEADRCDCIGVLDEGHLIAMGTPADLKATIGGDIITMFCRNPQQVANRIHASFGITATAADGVLRIERDRGHEFVPQLVEAFPGEVQSVTVGRPTLDDVFLHLTGHRLWRSSIYDEPR
jgi:ABC-2 type transport system ATP-binding protein